MTPEQHCRNQDEHPYVWFVCTPEGVIISYPLATRGHARIVRDDLRKTKPGAKIMSVQLSHSTARIQR